jgi:hypothetical protein
MNELTENFSKEDQNFTFVSDKTAIVFKQRIMEVFQDMYDLGYI